MHHAINVNLNVKLAHPLNDCLAYLLVRAEPERRALSGKLDQCLAYLLLICLGLGIHDNLDDRFEKFHLPEDDSMVLVT
jgi:hypothetical protein